MTYSDCLVKTIYSVACCEQSTTTSPFFLFFLPSSRSPTISCNDEASVPVIASALLQERSVNIHFYSMLQRVGRYHMLHQICSGIGNKMMVGKVFKQAQSCPSASP